MSSLEGIAGARRRGDSDWIPVAQVTVPSGLKLEMIQLSPGDPDPMGYPTEAEASRISQLALDWLLVRGAPYDHVEHGIIMFRSADSAK